MNKARLAAHARSQLDGRFSELGPSTRYTTPVRGWIKAVREALGMSTAQLAKRLGIKQPSLVALEQSEAKGTIELATLRRVAVALDCTLVYALVPNTSLDDVVRARARKIARRELGRVAHTMKLEAQGTGDANLEARIEAYVRDVLKDRDLWNEL